MAGPVLKKARRGAPAAAGAAATAAGAPAVSPRGTGWRKQARVPPEDSGWDAADTNASPKPGQQTHGALGADMPAGAPARDQGAREGKHPRPGRPAAGSGKAGAAAEGGYAPEGPCLPPHDFFMKASQKRAQREAEATAARETTRLAAEEEQRQHAKVWLGIGWPAAHMHFGVL